MRGMVAFTLRGAGHEVTEAENGQLALDAARGNAFELVLADVNMPVMDGIAMVRELRALDAYKGVPILMLTTESHTEKKMEGKAAGATGWLVKPFDPEQLLATVKRVLG
jgi:two-component system chemotaxis response regulator CheY